MRVRVRVRVLTSACGPGRLAGRVTVTARPGPGDSSYGGAEGRVTVAQASGEWGGLVGARAGEWRVGGLVQQIDETVLLLAFSNFNRATIPGSLVLLFGLDITRVEWRF